MLKLLALDLSDAGVEITEREVFFSKGGGVRFLRYLLSAFNMYLTPAWVVYTSDLRPNREQLIRFETILEGKYIQLFFEKENTSNSELIFFPLLFFPLNHKFILD